MDCGDTNEKFGSSHQRHVVFTYPFYFLFTQINNKLAPHHVLAKEQGASAAVAACSLQRYHLNHLLPSHSGQCHPEGCKSIIP